MCSRCSKRLGNSAKEMSKNKTVSYFPTILILTGKEVIFEKCTDQNAQE